VHIRHNRSLISVTDPCSWAALGACCVTALRVPKDGANRRLLLLAHRFPRLASLQVYTPGPFDTFPPLLEALTKVPPLSQLPSCGLSMCLCSTLCATNTNRNHS